MKNGKSQKKKKEISIKPFSIIQSSSIFFTYKFNFSSFPNRIILQTHLSEKEKNLPTLQFPQILSHVKIKIPPGLYSWRFAIRFVKVIHLRDRIPLRDPIRLAVISEPVKVSGRRLKISSRYWPVFRIFLERNAWHETYVASRKRKIVYYAWPSSIFHSNRRQINQRGRLEPLKRSFPVAYFDSWKNRLKFGVIENDVSYNSRSSLFKLI